MVVHVVREIGRHEFDRCPICLAPGPSTREHVPPASIGGTVKTLVCQRCNNDLGSRIEVDLLDWRDDAVRGARISGGAVQGFRRFDRLLLRTTADDEFILISQGRRDPQVDEMFSSGAFDLEVVLPDPAKYQLAALKHAYLAACLDRQEIPDTATARQIRRDLLAARDAPPGSPLSISDYARSIPLMRSYEQHAGPPLALGRVDGAARLDGRSEVCILLGGSLCMSWPMPDFGPAL